MLFAAAAGVAIYSIWPHDFAFGHNLDPWIKEMGDGEDFDVTEFAFNVGRDFTTAKKANEMTIRRLYNALSMLCVLLGLQVLAWGVAVI